jgi:hypothetical protein
VSGHGEKLSRRKEAAIAALLMHPTLTDAATGAGVSLATLRRWLRMSEFQLAYQAAREEVVERAMVRLEAQAEEAANALIRNLSSGRPAAEIRAAVAILEHVMMGRILALGSANQDVGSDRTIHMTVGGDRDVIAYAQDQTPSAQD